MINSTPIGYVRSSRNDASDDGWDAVEAQIEICPEFIPIPLKVLRSFPMSKSSFFLTALPRVPSSVVLATLATIPLGHVLVFLPSAARIVLTDLASPSLDFFIGRIGRSRWLAWTPLTERQCSTSNR